ncbi:hypothetical protein [Allomeiothermus silvanus]|uniref:hypothetical protein n=1 Tax=Allomeiothermus silvanus TaxID=52022 RepID=UPI0023F3AC7D|nr:hypothetical protein [Allomeiothermus silvanus]
MSNVLVNLRNLSTGYLTGVQRYAAELVERIPQLEPNFWAIFAATSTYLVASFAMSWFNNLLYYPLFLLLLLPWMLYWHWQGGVSE